ncbi:unnamed protein product [Thelazia callipaeda]|uniref:KASH domain-containing protein n=1 Tax=Thelazia callipaeda TaxID=103827 RepID=A0A3P7L5I4_THECL|nr:unnamed protein product [Thelazia callipaeda]
MYFFKRWLPVTDIDEQRRHRIQFSPVKSFYKTVPLDETGATDTETPRVSMSSWSNGVGAIGNLGYPVDSHILTDSLIVNTEEEEEETKMNTNDDIKEILSMLTDDENGNPKWEAYDQRGTQWREFKYGKNRYQLPFKRNWIIGSVDDDKHSCDASSEESDDLPTDLNVITETTSSTLPDLRPISLKRRRRGRWSVSDRFPSISSVAKISSGILHDIDNTKCSQTWSEIPHTDNASASLALIRPPLLHNFASTFRGRGKHQIRRKLRARRFPRSMSDGEHLGICLSCKYSSCDRFLPKTSMRSAPPEMSASHWSTTTSTCLDSDATGFDQSDAPPYEWDDYKPPAKAEDDDPWDNDKSDRKDLSVLTIEDDYQMELSDNPLASFPAHLYQSANSYQSHFKNKNHGTMRERTLRPMAAVTGHCLSTKTAGKKGSSAWKCGKVTDKKPITSLPLSSSSLLLLSSPSSSLSSSKTLNASFIRHFSDSDLNYVTRITSESSKNIEKKQSTSHFTTQSVPLSLNLSDYHHHYQQQQQQLSSPLPTILSKIEKFASSLKLIQRDDSGCGCSLSTISSIRSLDDVDIHERLLEEQEELHSLLSSDSFSGDFSELLKEFEPLCKGYQEAVDRVEQLMAQIETIREKWNDWAETQQIMQTMMRTIENDLSELRKGADNSQKHNCFQQISSELQLCQERMNRLETTCNYLSCSLASLHRRPSQSSPIDFTSELALYSNAFIQLKTRFEKEIGRVKGSDKATLVRSRKRLRIKDDEKQMLSKHNTYVNTVTTVINRTHCSLKIFFIISIIAAFTALFATSTYVPWRTTIGPHLDYVNGPPPL